MADKAVSLLNTVSSFFRDHVPLLQGLQSAVTVVALLLGGWWSYRRFIRGREGYPRIEISLRASHRVLEGKYKGCVLMHVEAVLKNCGSTLARFSPHSGFLWVQQVRPVTGLVERQIDAQWAAASNGDPQPRPEWPLIAKTQWPQESQPCEIEPGESELLDFDLLIPPAIETVRVAVYARNERKRLRVRWCWYFPYGFERLAMGWPSVTFHDLLEDNIDDDDDKPSRSVTPCRSHVDNAQAAAGAAAEPVARQAEPG